MQRRTTRIGQKHGARRSAIPQLIQCHAITSSRPRESAALAHSRCLGFPSGRNLRTPKQHPQTQVDGHPVNARPRESLFHALGTNPRMSVCPPTNVAIPRPAADRHRGSRSRPRRPFLQALCGSDEPACAPIPFRPGTAEVCGIDTRRHRALGVGYSSQC